MRISHADEANASALDLWSQHNNITHNPWPPQSSSAPVLLNQPLYVRFLGSNLEPYRQHHAHIVPTLSSELYPFRQSGISRMEVGSSSSSRAGVVDGAAAELHLLGAPINFSGQVFVPPITARNMIQNQTTWASASGNTVLFGNSLLTSQAGTQFGVYPSQGANWLAYPNQHRILQGARRSSFSSQSEQRHRTMNLPSREHHQSNAVSRVQDPYTGLDTYRLNIGAMGIPRITEIFATAAREGRSGMSAVCAKLYLPNY